MMRQAGILLLAIGASFPVLASDCQISRGYWGSEIIAAESHGSLWRFDEPAFKSSAQLNSYFSTRMGCTLNDSLSAKGQISGQYVAQTRQPGTLAGKQNQGLGLLNEAVLSWSVNENLFIDTGKIRKNNGYLFAVSPLDLLRNTSGQMRSVGINAFGEKDGDFYDEGAWGTASTFYGDNGSIDLVLLPRLTRQHKTWESASNWSSVQRTNNLERYYLGYNATGLARFTPSAALLLGQQKTLALGASGNLSDSWLLSVEGTVSRGETWRHFDTSKTAAMLNYEEPTGDTYRQRKQRSNAELGIGLRYTSASNHEYGAEYYAQSQGYSRHEWNSYIKAAKFINGGYIIPDIPPIVFEPYRQPLQQYARLMAAESDNVNRNGYLLGKNYLTLYTRSNYQQLRKWDWRASAMINLRDRSGVYSLHGETHLYDQLAIYSGIARNFGGDETEFGTFGQKGKLYAGMRILW